VAERGAATTLPGVLTVEQASREALAGALAHPRFEIIPIKGVEEQLAALPPGATVTVTSSPTRGIENTLACAERVAGHGFRVVPHVAARLVRDEGHIRSIIRQLAALHIREIFVVGGDAREPVGPLSSGLQLLRAMAAIGHDLEAIGVPSYPERHPLIDEETLRQAFLDKQRYATYTVTQICFDPLRIVRWLADLRERGMILPISIGIPGLVDRRKLLGISMKIGVGESMRFLSKNAGLAAALLKPGAYRPDDLVESLAPAMANPAFGIQGLHINTFNQVERTETWRQELLRQLGMEQGRSGKNRAEQAV
jgi:methylenetetrahydrofolate reductase (NADPH)